MANLPRRHLVPETLGDDVGARHTWLHRLRKTPVLDLLRRWHRHLNRVHLANPTVRSAGKLNAVLRLVGAWQSTTQARFDRVQTFVPSALAKEPMPDEPVYSFDGFDFSYSVVASTAMQKNLRNKRVLAVVAGGLGDLVIFSQLARTLRRRFGTTIDVAHRGHLANDELIARLFQPCVVQKLPITRSVFKTYDHVLPLGMYHVLNGETIDDYFERSYGARYEAQGFEVDEDTEWNVLTRLRYRHEVDPKTSPVIFLQPRCRPLKHYPDFEALADALVQRGHKVALIGASTDSVMGDRIGKLANLCGMPVWDTMQAVKHAALVVSPDSLFLHVAGAFNVPSVSVFGPTSAYWASPYPKATVVAFGATCRFAPCWVPAEITPPCRSVASPPCLSQIPVDYLVKVIERKLAGTLSAPLVQVPRIPKIQIVRDYRDDAEPKDLFTAATRAQH